MKQLRRISIHSAIDLDDIPEENKHGNCYQVALETFLERPRSYILVHGVVSGQGPLEGIEYCHAWVLDGETVIDNTTRVRRLPKDFYYALGHIEITREYNYKQVLDMIDKFGTYGPWDKVFDKYP